MELHGARVLITGAAGGLGRAFIEALGGRGVKRIYAATRRIHTDLPHGVIPVRIDVTDPQDALAAAVAAPDVDLLINNAGINTHASLIGGSLVDIRRELETAYFGTLYMARAFAPVLERAGGGAMLNVLSALSWRPSLTESAYATAKSAAWALTNGLRIELQPQGTLVTALHMGTTRTPMAGSYTGEMNSPLHVVQRALDGLEAGEQEVIADDWTRDIKRALPETPDRW